MVLWHFFVHWTGGDYGAPSYGYLEPYDWLSGLLGLSFFSLVMTHYRKHNCHVRGCWRLGRHTLTDAADGVTYCLCRKHHPGVPDSPPTKQAIDLIHARNRGSGRPGES